MPRKRKNQKKINEDLLLVYILDGSGSMSTIQDDVVPGVNKYIDDQRKEKGKTLVSLTVFDTNLNRVHTAELIENVQPVTQGLTLMGGLTALYDAVGQSLKAVENSEDVKDMKKLVIIHTDGGENASREYSLIQVNEMITRLQDEGTWTFIFVGAGIDAWRHAKGMGFYQTNVVTTDKADQKRVYEKLGGATRGLRGQTAMASVNLTSTYMGDVAQPDSRTDNQTVAGDLGLWTPETEKKRRARKVS